MLFGALEAGGTKMVCAVADENGKIQDRISFPTRTPSESIPEIIDYFKNKDIAALGIGAFGPVDINKSSESYGHILDTPKLAWKYYDLLGNIQRALNVPIGLDTDVNCACLGEMTFGVAKGLDTVIYITIGTGVGVGICANGKLLHGMLHPEAGHILLTPLPSDNYKGKCPYHNTCFEGMAAGPAIEERWGMKGDRLADRSEVWELEAHYIAQALMNYIVILSPQKIILGGGVMHQKQLLPLIHKNVIAIMNGYIKTKEMQDIENYIVTSNMNDNQGILGCIQLAKMELQS